MREVFVDTDFNPEGQSPKMMAIFGHLRWLSETGIYYSEMARAGGEEDVQYRDGVHYDLNAIRRWINAPYTCRGDIRHKMEMWHREMRPDSWRERFKGVKGGLAMVDARAKYGEDARRILDEIYDELRLPDEELEAIYLSFIRAYVPRHYEKNEGKLGGWGEIKRYRYYSSNGEIVLDPDGNILTDVEPGPVWSWPAR